MCLNNHPMCALQLLKIKYIGFLKVKGKEERVQSFVWIHLAGIVVAVEISLRVEKDL